ncbi:Mitochondrial inner membrane i-AAA protease supercomplex subunit YME1 [Hypsizygus marmoreus]|uniref:Mitochondrial inner membrane i-AAA protease supercomplex subunit YME1 n=1 Tax=Hypsizygus marmoreus TaxID=39966 RepID=A0A369JFS3_HYPMA|nr:Mitochondrial inner membrane i-AAA protease supercomplex subunit YME1 [Hypsizygus marmoreus]
MLVAPLFSGAARPLFRNTLSLCTRHLSSSARHANTTLLRLNIQRTPTSILSLAPYSRRTLTLGSIFSRSKPVQTPSPLVVAHISRLEAEANVHPHDVAKQLALFYALADTKLKSSYDLIISRWERMCEFDKTSPLLHSVDAFQVYLTALIHTGQKASINPAVRRRDSLLALSPLASPAGQVVNGVSSPTSIPTTPVDTTQPESSLETVSAAERVPQSEDVASVPRSSSQDIAQAVLASQAERAASQAGSASGDITKLHTAFDAGGSTSPIQVSIVERKGAWVPRLVRFVALVLVSSFFFLVILSVFFENTGFMKAGPRQSQFEPTEGKTVKFSDVHGVDEAKDELQDVVQFLKDPTAFASLGGKLPKGVLLTGSPGTGKTLLARAVAGEAGVPFFFASGSDFEEMFVGVGAKRVRELFAAARKKEPSIIFIDELDAVGGKRSSRDQQYMKQTLNQLLVEMDGFQQNEGVIVIAATNFPESLDQALVRPGRFDRIIAVPLPDIRGRVQILQHHMKGVVTASDVDPKVLARGTPGFSGADLQNMVNQAAIQASKEKATEVALKHFEWAKDRILMGAERKSQYIDQKNKLATAYHEGGHALVALYTDGAMPLHKVTCVPRGHALGFTSLLPENDRTSVTLKEYLAGIDVSMGGRVAEELVYGSENVSSGASSDIKNATRTAQNMVKFWGFSKLGPVFYDDRDEAVSPRRKEQIEEEVTKIVRGGEARAAALLTSKLEELHRLANALVEHETLDLEEVKKVIKGEPIRNITEVLDAELSNLEKERGESNP